MAWHRTGTISLTNGSTAVTGSGTAWVSNAAIGEALLAPDGRLYEIANIASDTSITLGSNYLGTTQSGQAYVIVPSQSYIRDLAAQAATLVNNYSTFYNTVGQGKFPDGAVGTPSISFSSDTNTGLYRSGTDEVTLVANGVAQAKWNASGFSILKGDAVITANSANPALKITQTGAGNALVVEDAASDTTPFVIDSIGRVGVCTSSPAVGNGVHIVGPGSGITELRLESSNASVGTPTANINLKRTETRSAGVSITDLADAEVAFIGIPYNGGSAANMLVARTAGTEALRIDSNQQTWVQANNTTSALKITQTGSGNALVVEDATNDTAPFVIDGNGQVLVNAASAVPGFSSISSPLQVNNGTGIAAAFTRFTADASDASVQFLKSRNATYGSHTVVNSGDALGSLRFLGSDGSAFIQAATISAAVDGTPGTNDMPGRLVFSTTPDGSATAVERMRIDSSGNVTVRSAAGLGYGTGAGGTVTQATSKSTGVTLNKPCGQITMYGVNDANGQLAAGASAVFTLTNSVISSQDVLLLNGSAAGSKYEIACLSCGTGAANIRVTNITAGTLAEALVINFAVIKGAIS